MLKKLVKYSLMLPISIINPFNVGPSNACHCLCRGVNYVEYYIGETYTIADCGANCQNLGHLGASQCR